ncbi:MAG: radical SAM protein [Planctomycetes bacterium]|nr:radical SAM protein [Planctomycetota bacterium]MCL4728956.1 radical SAM protein [Planctomycetota bacterium]
MVCRAAASSRAGCCARAPPCHTRAVRYEGRIYRPPSEAGSYILQATIGCSWNHCTYCDMYRDKSFRVRDLNQTLEDIRLAARLGADRVDKVFVADGDALAMDMPHWREVLAALRENFPRLRRVSCYATALNILQKSAHELRELRELGLGLLYIGPESGDDVTLRHIAKGATFEQHAQAAQRAHAAGLKLSAIFLLGAGGTERSAEHAEASARLATAMNPRFLSVLTLTVVPGTPLARLEAAGRFTLPDVNGLLRELRVFVARARPQDAIFRTNHASNYLPLSGRLPRDSGRLVELLDAAIEGRLGLRPEWMRGL